MMAAKRQAPDAHEVLVLRRSYAVSPQKVWRAWIDAGAIRTWFGQDEAAGWQAEMDVRVGGRYRFTMLGSAGHYYEAYGVYREVVPDRRLVFSWTWQAGPDAAEAVITVDLKQAAGGTDLEFTLDPMIDARERDAWRADFKRLGLLLEEKS